MGPATYLGSVWRSVQLKSNVVGRRCKLDPGLKSTTRCFKTLIVRRTTVLSAFTLNPVSLTLYPYTYSKGGRGGRQAIRVASANAPPGKAVQVEHIRLTLG